MLELVYRETVSDRIDVYVSGQYQGKITRSTWDLRLATSTVRETYAAETPVKASHAVWSAVEQLLEREARQYSQPLTHA